MQLSGLLPLLDDLPEFGQLAKLANAAARPPAGAGVAGVAAPAVEARRDGAPVTADGVATSAAADGQRFALPPPAALAAAREAAKPYLVAGLQRRLGRPIVLLLPSKGEGAGG